MGERRPGSLCDADAASVPSCKQGLGSKPKRRKNILLSLWKKMWSPRWVKLSKKDSDPLRLCKRRQPRREGSYYSDHSDPQPSCEKSGGSGPGHLDTSSWAYTQTHPAQRCLGSHPWTISGSTRQAPRSRGKQEISVSDTPN